MVELMMSLIIIGLLVSLLGVGVNFALKRAKQVQVLTEINNLDVAMQSYKNQFGSEYPPCMGIPVQYSKATVSRYDQFNRAIRKRFPRATDSYRAKQGPNDTAANPFTNNSWWVRNINNPSGNPIQLDLDHLDAAESLVLWLAGPPTPFINPPAANNNSAPTNSSVLASNNVLWGFCANPTTPFLPYGSRAPFLYDFDETRLTDVDQDGWPEYSPQGTGTKSISGAGGSVVAPYVYFDASSYVYYHSGPNGTDYAHPFYACYPADTLNVYPQFLQASNYQYPGLPIPSALPNAPGWQGRTFGEFGAAMPYLTNVAPPANNTSPYNYTFWNPKKFQIIAAGPDNEYGGSIYEPDPTMGSSGGGRPFCPLIPQTGNQGVKSPSYTLLGTPILLQGEYDNLTNFSDSKLEDYTPQ